MTNNFKSKVNWNNYSKNEGTAEFADLPELIREGLFDAANACFWEVYPGVFGLIHECFIDGDKYSVRLILGTRDEYFERELEYWRQEFEYLNLEGEALDQALESKSNELDSEWGTDGLASVLFDFYSGATEFDSWPIEVSLLEERELLTLKFKPIEFIESDSARESSRVYSLEVNDSLEEFGHLGHGAFGTKNENSVNKCQEFGLTLNELVHSMIENRLLSSTGGIMINTRIELHSDRVEFTEQVEVRSFKLDEVHSEFRTWTVKADRLSIQRLLNELNYKNFIERGGSIERVA